MLYCEGCGGRKGMVFSVRYLIDKGILGLAVRRRRVCGDCGHKWTTVEVNKSELMKIQADLEETRKNLQSLQRLEAINQLAKFRKISS